MALIRTLCWRLLGMRVGAGTLLPRIHVTWPHQVSLGADCTVEQGAYFKYDGIWASGPRLVIGDHVFIGAGCEFNFKRGITIGSHCLIASGCSFNIENKFENLIYRKPIPRPASPTPSHNTTEITATVAPHAGFGSRSVLVTLR